MNSQSLTIITMICLAFLAAIPMFVSNDQAEKKSPEFADCEARQRMAIPVTATYSFPYCAADSTVWMNGRWDKPTPFEQRHINWHIKDLEGQYE